MSCPCDKLIHPPGLVIPAGLDIIPRQIASFPEFRRAMLAAIRSQDALINWRARGEVEHAASLFRDDLGIMLLEMWAYVCDALAFYDEVIAHEAYLRTARLRSSLRRLVDLLGYVPSPAVAASVKLALFAEGRQPVTIPAGTAFRSGSFDVEHAASLFRSEQPQIFELGSDATIHPLTNKWTVEPARPETFRFSRDFMRAQMQRVQDPRSPDVQTAVRLTLPPEYLLIHRTLTGGVGVLCQLEAEVPFRRILEELMPGFTDEV